MLSPRLMLPVVAGAVVILLARASASPVKPNMLLLFPDQWRWDWDGFHTDPTGPIPLHMPWLASFAKRATRFTDAYVAAPLCAPSRSCLAAGKEYDEAGVASNFFNDYPVNQTTFYKVLRDDGGYWTMTTGKDDLTKKSQPGPNGLFHQEALGFSDGLRCSGKLDVMTGGPHEPYGLMLNATTVHTQNGSPVSAWAAHVACLHGRGAPCDNTSYPASLYEDNWVAENAITLMNRAPQGKPWFMQVNFPGPHSPFVTTADMHDSVAGRKWPKPTDNDSPVKCGGKNREPGDGGRCNYAAELENLDARFAQVVAALGDSVDDALVCVSSDHGEMLDDHHDSGKTMPWSGSARVPLMCAGPGITAGAQVQAPVTTMDLAATFLDYAGVAKAPGMTSTSLRPLLEGDQSALSAPPRGFVSSGLQSSNFGSAQEEVVSDYERAVAVGVPLPNVAPETDVESGKGGYNWRLVVKAMNETTTLKFVCCKGKCNGSPSTVPKPKNGWTKLLYNTGTDPFDMHSLTHVDPDAAEELRKLLPPSFGCPA